MRSLTMGADRHEGTYKEGLGFLVLFVLCLCLGNGAFGKCCSLGYWLLLYACL